MGSLSAETTNKNDTAKTNVVLRNTIGVELDLASLAAKAMGGSTYSMEGAINLNIKNKLLTVFELGLSGADKTSVSDIRFKTDAPFGRIGIDLNIVKASENSKVANNMFLIGARLGASSFAYDVTNIVIADDYWANSVIHNYAGYSYNNFTATKLWFEIVASIRVEIAKNFYMGWSVRNKNLISKDLDDIISPWYIPGYGKNASSNWGANYVIGYRF